MKKGLWKKGLALALAAVIPLQLGACGGKDENTQQAKENVYSFQDIIQLGTQENVNESIENVFYKDDMLYMMITRYVYDPERDTEVTYGYYKMGVDGSDKSFVELVSPEREGNSGYINSSIFTDGYIYAVENSYYEDWSDPENYIWEDRYFLNCWDRDGKLQWSAR
ncbi:MAG: hypothetical protein K2I21_10630, partial [Acetatifactor sp.]|nr:hypothetical protein [Acetatifactor sp.]